MMKIHLTGSGKNNRISKPLLYSLLGILVGIGIISIFLNKESIWFLSEAGDKPVAHWKFDEGQGSTAYDSMASNNGTLGTGSSAPAWASEDMCVSGKCLKFDGTNDQVSAGDINALDGLVTLTTEVWVKPSEAKDYQQIMGKLTTNNINGWAMQTYSGAQNKRVFLAVRNGGGNFGYTNEDFNLNEWQHWAMVYDGSQTGNANRLKFYLNGVQKTLSFFETVPASIASTSESVLFGNASGTYFNGYIDEPKIYNYARTADQIRADYNARGGSRGINAQFGYPARASGTNLSQGLVGYWKMDEAAANTCTGGTNDTCDASGNVLDGAWNGNATTAVGKFGNGVTFDGTDDYISVSDSGPLDVTTASFAGWIKPTVNGGRIIDKESVGGSDGYLIDTYSGNLRICTNNCFGSNATLTTGVWTHFVVTIEGSSTKIYINGSLDRTTGIINAPVINALNLRFGIDQNGGSDYNGAMDEMRIYNRALSESEVRALYNWAPGPQVYWDLNENAGTTTLDKSGNGYNGTLGTGSSAPNWVAGKFGSALNFDGSNDIVSKTSFSPMNRSNGREITVSAWIKPNWTSGYRDIVANRTNTGNTLNWILYQHGDTGEIGFHGTAQNKSSYIPTNNVWTHISATVDSASVMRIYANGLLVSTVQGYSYGTGSDSVLEVGFGAYNGTGEPFKGSIDEVKIYNYARTPAQIVEDMNAGHPAPGSPVGSAVSYYKFDEGYGTTANDSSSNANNLTLSSASWTNSGKIGKAWNGTNASWMSRADDPDFDFNATDPLSISFWFKSDNANNPGATEYMVNKSNATTAGYAVYANTSGNICFAIDDDATWSPDVSACTATDVYDGTWHHVVATRDITADTINIFLDGELKDSDTDSTTATLENALSFYVGDRDGVDNGDEFAGDIDELKLYRFALNKEQVSIEFSQGKSQVLGSLSTESDGETASHGSDRAPCVPGDTSNCTSPVGTYAFDETTGSTAYNKGSGGASNDGAITQAVLGKKGKVNTAFQFDGVDDRVIVSSSQLIKNSASGGAICTWVYPTNADSTDDIIYSEDALGGTHLHLRRNGTGNKFEFGINDSVGTWRWATSPSSHVANRWYYVCGTFSLSPNLVNLYVDGAQVAQNTSWNGTFQNTQAVINVLIGDMTNAGNWGWGGLIDEVRIYNYTRTPAQIAWEYNEGAPIAWYKMDECSGTAIYNSAKNGNGDAAGNNGTLTIGGSGSNTSVGTCATSGAWYDAATGKINSAMDFDGTDDYVTVSGTIPTNSVALWVKPNTNSASLVQLTSGAYISASSGVITATGFTSPTYYVNGTLTTSPILTANVWNHIVITTTTSLTANTISFGMANGSYTSGQIDEVKIFNYPLTSAQVKDVYNGGAVSFR